MQASNANDLDQDQLNRQFDELYAKFGKPLEASHRGEYLAIAPDGRTLTGATLLEVLERADAQFGKGNFLYKIGERAVGKWLDLWRN